MSRQNEEKKTQGCMTGEKSTKRSQDLVINGWKFVGDLT